MKRLLHRIIVPLAMLATCLPSGFAHAEPAPRLPPQAMQELAALPLSPAQRIELLTILLDARSSTEQLRTQQQALAAQAVDQMEAQRADLHALINTQEALTDQRVAALRVLRDDLLAFYDTLSIDQQAEVQTWLARQLQRLLDLRTAIDLLRD